MTDQPTKVLQLDCGCWLMSDGAIWMVCESTMPALPELYTRPGRFIPVHGEPD